MTTREFEIKRAQVIGGFGLALMVVVMITIYATTSTMAGDLAECGDLPVPAIEMRDTPDTQMSDEQYKDATNAWEGCKVAVVNKWLDKRTQP